MTKLIGISVLALTRSKLLEVSLGNGHDPSAFKETDTIRTFRSITSACGWL